MTFDGSGNNWEIQPNDWFQELPVFQEFTDLPQTTLPADLLFDAVSQQPDGLYPSHLSSYGTSNSLTNRHSRQPSSGAFWSYCSPQSEYPVQQTYDTTQAGHGYQLCTSAPTAIALPAGEVDASTGSQERTLSLRYGFEPHTFRTPTLGVFHRAAAKRREDSAALEAFQARLERSRARMVRSRAPLRRLLPRSSLINGRTQATVSVAAPGVDFGASVRAAVVHSPITNTVVDPNPVVAEGISIAPPANFVAAEFDLVLPPASPYEPRARSPPVKRLPNGKLLCAECTLYPDGFRGEHELRRHKERIHKPVRRGYVVVDPNSPCQPASPVRGPSSSLLNFSVYIPEGSILSNCIPCSQGKRYNACHNAISHLRRVHFPMPKTEQEKAGTLKGEKPEGIKKHKRSEKLTAGRPSLSYLLTWVKQVDYRVNEDTERAALRAREQVAEEQRQVSVPASSSQQQQAQPPPALLSSSEPPLPGPVLALPQAWDAGLGTTDWELILEQELLRYNRTVPD